MSIEKNLNAEKQLSSKPTSTTTLDDHSVAAMFLRDFRGRTDVATITLSQSSKNFSSTLEKVRNLITTGYSMAAQTELEKLVPSNEAERFELAIAQMKIYELQRNFVAITRIGQKFFENKHHASLVSQMTFLQLLAQAEHMQERHDRALVFLNEAKDISTLYPHALSASQVRAFLVKIYSELGKHREAQHELGILRSSLRGSTIINGAYLDRLYAVLRAQYHFYKNTQQVDGAVSSLLSGLELAKWLEYTHCIAQCNADLKAINNHDFELKVYRFENWSYLPEEDLILAFNPRDLHSLRDKDLMKTTISLLAKHQSLSNEELFHRVSGREYRKDSDDNYLRSLLSKVRKLLPDGALSYANGRVWMK